MEVENVVTVYYSDSTISGPDEELVSAFADGRPVFAYLCVSGDPKSIKRIYPPEYD